MQKALQEQGKELQKEVQAYLEKLYEDNVQREKRGHGESSVQAKVDTPPHRVKRCLVQLHYGGKDVYLSMENKETVLEAASAYHNEVMDRLGKDGLEKLGERFGNAMSIPEGSYGLLAQSMNINNTIRAALKFDFDNGLLSVCDNKKGKWKTYDLDTVSLAVLAAEQPDYSTDKERLMDFKEALQGKALKEDEIQNRLQDMNGKWVEKKNERILYAAYGRFLKIGLMRQCCPYARLVGTGKIEGYELEFRGDDYDADATIIENEKSTVPVAVWSLGGRAKVNLDYCEYYPSLFRKATIPVKMDDGRTVECMAYVMNQEMGHGIATFHDREDIADGYEDHGFDTDILVKALKKSTKLCRAEKREAKLESQGDTLPLVRGDEIKM